MNGDTVNSEASDLTGTMRAIVQKAWYHRRILFACQLGAVLLALVYLHVVSYKYDVELQVTSVTDQAKGRNGLLGNLASVAGIDLPSGGSDDANPFDLFLQNIYTRQTADILATDQGLMHEVFSDQWDSDTGTWRKPSAVKTAVVNTVKTIVGMPIRSWTPPDGAQVQDFITRFVNVARNPRTPIVIISMRYGRPEAAKHFLARLHAVNDNWLRAQTLARTSKYIEYLNTELQKVTVEEYRRALGDILSEQEKRRMFASSPSVNYSAQIFEAPTAAVKPSSPNFVTVLLMGIILGTGAGIALAVFADRWLIRRFAFLAR